VLHVRRESQDQAKTALFILRHLLHGQPREIVLDRVVQPVQHSLDYALQVIKESGGAADAVTDDEIVEGIKLLASSEGIFAETAGGVTIATLKKLVESGKIRKNELCVAFITGTGLKTQEALQGKLSEPQHIKPNLAAFENSQKILVKA
jgi:threonine synthase